MATLSGSQTTSTIVGKAEDVEDALYDISVDETEFLKLVGDTRNIKSIFHTWYTDKLRQPRDNAKPEANVYAFSTQDQPVEVGNYLQISDEAFSIPGTVEAIKMYGRGRARGGEEKRLLKKTAREIALDVERVMIGQTAGSKDAGSDGIRRCGSFGSFLTSNTDRGNNGADGGYNQATKKTQAPTDGDLRNFTETILQDAQESAYQNGGKPKVLMLPTALKRTFSNFPGLGEKRQTHEMSVSGRRRKAILAAMDFYIGDFGTVGSLVAHIQRPRDAYLIDPNFVEVGILRKFETKKLAKRADSTDYGMTMEYTLVVKNEAAHCGMHDLQPA